MLGCVKTVADFEVNVGLPCGLQGFLSIKNICDSYTKLLSDQLESDDAEVSLQTENPTSVEGWSWFKDFQRCLHLHPIDLLPAPPFPPRHGAQMCGRSVGCHKRRITEHPAVNQPKTGQQERHFQLPEGWNG